METFFFVLQYKLHVTEICSLSSLPLFLRVWWMVQLPHVKERPQHGNQEHEHRVLPRETEGRMHQPSPGDGEHRPLATLPQECRRGQALHTGVFGSEDDGGDRESER